MLVLCYFTKVCIKLSVVNASSLHWLNLSFFYTFFVQWSLFPKLGFALNHGLAGLLQFVQLCSSFQFLGFFPYFQKSAVKLLVQ